MPDYIKRSFTAGELSPGLRSRADISSYQSGLSLCQNYIVRPQGGIDSRPGFKHIGEVEDSTKRARLIPFTFNTDQTYVLVFEEYKITFITEGEFILDGGVKYEVTTPYTEADLARLDFTQSADVMTITHINYPPMNLSRFADTNWTLTAIDFSAVSFWHGSFSPTPDPVTTPYMNSSVRIFHSNVNPWTILDDYTVEVVLTSPGDIDEWYVNDEVWINGTNSTVGTIDDEVNNKIHRIIYSDVSGTDLTLRFAVDTTVGTDLLSGSFIKFKASTVHTGSGSASRRYQYVVTAVTNDGFESSRSMKFSTGLVQALDDETSNTIAFSIQTPHLVRDVGIAYYKVYRLDGGTDIFGWIGNIEVTLGSNIVEFTDANFLADTTQQPPEYSDPFSGSGNYPSCVEYYQQRRIYANTFNKPQTTWASKTNDFESLQISSPLRDDDAIEFTIAARQLNEIRHIISIDSMILLTSAAEWLVTEGQDQVLTPSTIGVRTQSVNGVSWTRPVIVNDTIIYVQEKGTKLRTLIGNVNNGSSYSGIDLSVMSSHLFEGYDITEMAYTDEPWGVLWCVRNDGVLLGLTYNREQEVWGWHQHNTQGEFESVTSITEDGRDALYTVVKRTIDGTTTRFVERLEKRVAVNNEAPTLSYFVDCGSVYNGTPTNTYTVAHLPNTDVTVLADGVVYNDITTDGTGMITLPYDIEASVIIVGLAYTPRADLMEIDMASAMETLKTDEFSISKITFEMMASAGLWAGALDQYGSVIGEMNEIKPRNELDNYDAVKLRTSKSELMSSPGWTQYGAIRFEQRNPLPSSILSVMPKFDVSGR